MTMSPTNHYAFPLKPDEYAPRPVPSLEEWQQLWKVWDLVTTKMIPSDALMEKPIPLRNPLLFYLGHIPAFEDIHLTRATDKKATEPPYYHIIFERGIDPDVDDPSKCHDHSELPDVFPSPSEILDYRERVKTRIRDLYTTGQRPYEDRCVGRALWIGFEHEALHIETFLYMTLLSPNVRPPPDLPRPDFAGLAAKAVAERAKENTWFRIPRQTFTVGYEDPESDDPALPDRFFAWDNERAPYDATVPAFEAQARPVSIGEYAAYLVDAGVEVVPVTWVKLDADINDRGTSNGRDGEKGLQNLDDNNDTGLTNGEATAKLQDKETELPSLSDFIARHAMRTVWGPIPLREALDWPLTASYNEVSGYARWVGGGVRIPTLHEVRSIHHFAERLKENENRSDSAADMSNGNGHGENGSSINAINKTFHTSPQAIFADLTGTNSGFQNFHPTPVTQNGGKLCGLGDLGGAGEWTSDLFAPQPGFEAMGIYPGYSADFMDGKHMAIVSGSWALHPRIAGRKSFLNWWQKNYLYPWVAVRTNGVQQGGTGWFQYLNSRGFTAFLTPQRPTRTVIPTTNGVAVVVGYRQFEKKRKKE